MVWGEIGKPDLEFARKFAEGVRKVHTAKLFAYNCSPSFNWKRNLDDATIAKLHRELAAMGYKFQFITLAGFHSLNYSMFELRSEEYTSELQSLAYLVCRLLLEKKKKRKKTIVYHYKFNM